MELQALVIDQEPNSGPLHPSAQLFSIPILFPAWKTQDGECITIHHHSPGACSGSSSTTFYVLALQGIRREGVY